MVKDTQAYIGAGASLQLDKSFTVRVVITDMRNSYGQLQARVTPVTGDGHQWVSFGRLTQVDLSPDADLTVV